MAALRLAARLPALAPDDRSRVLAFARPAARAAAFTVAERIEIARWSCEGAAVGIGRVRLEPVEEGDASDIGGFVLLYRHGAVWACWGVARGLSGGFELWETQRGTTLGTFPTLQQVFAAIAAVV